MYFVNDPDLYFLCFPALLNLLLNLTFQMQGCLRKIKTSDLVASTLPYVRALIKSELTNFSRVEFLVDLTKMIDGKYINTY